MAAVFTTSSLRACVDWYTEKLGFAASVDWSTNPGFVIAQRDAASIMLKSANTPSAPVRRLVEPLNLFDAYFWVGDLDVIIEDLKRRGVDIVEGPVVRAYGCQEILVEDPDGRYLCFGFCP